MKKLFFLLLSFPLFFAACSSDDEEGGDEFTNMKLTSESVLDKLELQWTKVDKAYGYQVYFQIEGETEWQETNFRMAKADDPAIIRWDGGEFNYFNESVTYTIYVKAFRDSQEGSVIGESNKIVETFSDDSGEKEPQVTIIGGWKIEGFSGFSKSNMPQFDVKIGEFIGEAFGYDLSSADEILYFSTDLIYKVYEGDELSASGTYTLVDNLLTITFSADEVKVYEIDLHANTFSMIFDIKQRLVESSEEELREIVGADNYKDFKLERALHIVNTVRID